MTPIRTAIASFDPVTVRSALLPPPGTLARPST